MQKFLRSFLTVATLTAAMTVSAQDSQALFLGYCNEDVVVPGKITTSGETDPSAAIYLPYEKLAEANAEKIIKVRAGLGAVARVTSVTCWVRTSLDGANLVEATKTEGLETGWNEFTFATPYDLTEGQGVYVGYTFHQTASTTTITATGTLPYISGSYWAKTKTEGSWKETKTRGALYIQAGVPADGIPAYDIALSNFSGPEALWMGDDLRLDFDVTNYGVNVCRGINVNAQIEGLPSSDFEATVQGTPIRFGETTHYSVQMPVSGQTTGDYTVNITVSPVEGADVNPDNNSASYTFAALGDKFRRNVLVEEFTTEKCPNCPAAAAALKQTIESYDAETRARISAVCHHCGYYTDQFTIEESKQYMWFYGGDSSYAPAFMVNRATFSDSDDNGVTFFANTVPALKQHIDPQLAMDAPVAVKVAGTYATGSKTVRADVTVLNGGVAPDPNHRLTVMLLEDNIPTTNQAGSTGEYVQAHVARAMNAAWGVEMTDWQNGELHYSYTFNVKPEWKSEDLILVALVANRDAGDRRNNEVLNSKHVEYSDFTVVTGVENVLDDAVDTNAPAEYYNLQGVRVNGENLTPGLYIVRQGGKSTKTIIR